MQVKKYAPHIYDGVYEFEKIFAIQQDEADSLESEFQLAFDRQFVLSADSVGVAQYEALLELSVPETDTLEKRKERVILTLMSGVPFTLNYLKVQLDRIMGEGKWKCWVDFPNYALYIQGVASDNDFFFALSNMVHKVKPANIVYVYQPLITQGIKANETVKASPAVWKYKLGGWRLGEFPFISEQLEVLKLPANSSLTSEMLNKSATALAALIDHVVLNDDITIALADLTKTITTNSITLNFVVPATSDPVITSCKIYSADNIILSSSEFSVAVGETTQFQVIWNIVEGV